MSQTTNRRDGRGMAAWNLPLPSYPLLSVGFESNGTAAGLRAGPGRAWRIAGDCGSGPEIESNGTDECLGSHSNQTRSSSDEGYTAGRSRIIPFEWCSSYVCCARGGRAGRRALGRASAWRPVELGRRRPVSQGGRAGLSRTSRSRALGRRRQLRWGTCKGEHPGNKSKTRMRRNG